MTEPALDPGYIQSFKFMSQKIDHDMGAQSPARLCAMLPPNSANKQHPGQGHLRLVRRLAQNGTSGHRSSCLAHSRNICLSVCLSAMPPADSRSTPLPLTEQSDGSFEGVRECVCVAMCVCVVLLQSDGSFEGSYASRDACVRRRVHAEEGGAEDGGAG